MENQLDSAAIGRRLRQAREAKYMQAAVLCQLIGVSKQLWSGYEAGRARITPENAARAGKVLNVSLEWIYLGSEKDLNDDLRHYLLSKRRPRK